MPTSQARGLSGSALQMLPSTTWMGGMMAWIPLANTDCSPVPPPLVLITLLRKNDPMARINDPLLRKYNTVTEL